MRKLKEFLSFDNCCLKREFKEDLRRERKISEYKNLF